MRAGSAALCGAALRRLILARRHAHDALEEALQMKRADMHGFAQLRERDALLRIGVERGARAVHDLDVAWQAAGLAALAVAIAGGAGVIRRVEKLDVFTAWRPRRTRRTAENARRADGEEKRTIGFDAAFGDGGPALCVGGPGGTESVRGVHDVPDRTVSMFTNVVGIPSPYAPLLALSFRPSGQRTRGLRDASQVICDKLSFPRVFP